MTDSELGHLIEHAHYLANQLNRPVYLTLDEVSGQMSVDSTASGLVLQVIQPIHKEHEGVIWV